MKHVNIEDDTTLFTELKLQQIFLLVLLQRKHRLMLFPLLLFTFLPTLVLLGCEEIMKMTVGPRSHASSQPSVTDNGYIYQVIGSSMVHIILWHDVKTHPETSPLILQIILKTLFKVFVNSDVRVKVDIVYME